MPTLAFAASITGSASYRERIALPADATFEVTVEDVSRADAPATVIGRMSFMPAGQVPIRFEVPYDASKLQQNHRYSLRVRILQGQALLYTSTQSHPVLTQGAGNTVEMMMLQRVISQLPKPDRSVTNTYWKLTELNGAPVKAASNQREPHMILQIEGNRVVGSGGCNRITGDYRLDGPAVSFGKVASTRMACPDGMQQEAAYLKALDGARGFEVHGDVLDLRDESGTTIARFIAVDLR